MHSLEAAGIDTTLADSETGEQVTTLATVIVSRNPLDRTIFVETGAQLVRGDQLDVAGLFGGDVLVLDVADVSLRRFLLDLPAHTVPTTRILGPLTLSRGQRACRMRSTSRCGMTSSSAMSPICSM